MSARYAPGWYLALSLLAMFLLVSPGFDVSEGIEHAEWARAIVRTGEVGLPAPLSPNWVRGVDERYYSAHEIGNAVALVPTAWVAARARTAAERRGGEALGASLERALLPMAAAAYVALTLVACYRLSVDALHVPPTSALVATAALGTTTILLPYSRMLFDGVLGGMLVAWALVWADRAAATRHAAPALLAGIVLGAAIATRQTLAVFFIPVLAMLLWNGGRSPRMVAALALGCAPALLWQAWFNAVRTGAFYLPAASLPQFQNLTVDGSMIEGLAGLLISPGKSLFLYSPLLLLSLAGVRAFVRESRPLALGVVAAVAVYVLVHASIRNWAGEWGWGPRYLVPLTMPLALSAALVLDRARRTGATSLRLVALSVLSAGLAIQILAVSTNWHYRYSWLHQQGRFDLRTLAWSLDGNQLVETARMLAENVARFTGRGVGIRMVHGAAPATQAAANNINVWPVTAVREGVPPSLVAITCVVLLVVGVVSARAAFAKARVMDLDRDE